MRNFYVHSQYKTATRDGIYISVSIWTAKKHDFADKKEEKRDIFSIGGPSGFDA